MMVHPWDAAADEGEWRSWLAAGRDVGQVVLAVPDRLQQRSHGHDARARSQQLRRPETPQTGPT